MREVPPKIAAKLRQIASRPADGYEWHRRLFDRYEAGEHLCEAQLRMLRLTGYSQKKEEESVEY